MADGFSAQDRKALAIHATARFSDGASVLQTAVESAGRSERALLIRGLGRCRAVPTELIVREYGRGTPATRLACVQSAGRLGHVEILRRALADKDEQTRRTALRLISKTVARGDIPSLIAALDHPDYKIRELSLRSLAKTGIQNDAILLAAIKACGDPGPRVKVAAALLLTRFPGDEGAVSKLVSLIRTRELWAGAIEALGRMERSDEAIAALLMVFKSSSRRSYYRLVAAQALARQGHQPDDVMRTLVHWPQTRMRRGTLPADGGIKTLRRCKRTSEVLLKMLRSVRTSDVVIAACTLGQLKQAYHPIHLEQLRINILTPGRPAKHHCLNALVRSGDRSSESVRVLRAAIQSSEPSLRISAAAALVGRKGDSQAIEILGRALTDPKQALLAIRVLRRLSSPVKALLPSMSKAVRMTPRKASLIRLLALWNCAEAVPILTGLLEDPKYRTGAAQALVGSAPTGAKVASLVASLLEDPTLRVEVARKVSEHKWADKTIRLVLKKGLVGNDLGWSLECARALRATGDQDGVVEACVDVLGRGGERAQAAAVILGSLGPNVAGTAPALIAALGDPVTQLSALWAIGQSGPFQRRVPPVLQKILLQK